MRKVGEQSTRPNPWPLYAQLRSQRVFPLGEHSYAIGHYDDVVALLHDPRVSSNPYNLTDPGEAAITITDPLPFIAQDPPSHDRLRLEATRFFGPPVSPDLISGQEPLTRRLIAPLIDRFPRTRRERDSARHRAYPLPVGVI